MIDLTVDAVRAEKGMVIPWFIVTAFVASEPVLPPLIPWNGKSRALM